MTESMHQVLRNRGYDIYFRYNYTDFLINSREFTKEKADDLENQFGIRTVFSEIGLIFYDKNGVRIQ